METKGIEEMTKEELIDLVDSLNNELDGAKKALDLYRAWKDREESARILAEKKLLAAKAFFEVV